MKSTVVKQEAATQLDTDIDEDPIRPDTAPNTGHPPYVLHIRMPEPHVQGTQLHTQRQAVTATSRDRRLPAQPEKTRVKPVSFAWKQATPAVLQRSQSYKVARPPAQLWKPKNSSRTEKPSSQTQLQQLTATKSFDRFTSERQASHQKTVSAMDLGNALQDTHEYRSFAESLPFKTVSSREPIHLRSVTLQLRVQGMSCSAAPSLLHSPEPSSPMSIIPQRQLATVRLVWAADRQGVVLQSGVKPGCFRGSKVKSSRGVRFLRRPCARLSPNHFLAL